MIYVQSRCLTPYTFFETLKLVKKFPKSWTRVTPFSRMLALIIFTTFPVFGFFFGCFVQHSVDLANTPPPHTCMPAVPFR